MHETKTKAKARAKLDLWLKEISPSTELRRRCAPKVQHWEAFRSGYFKELDNNPDAVDVLRKYLRKGSVTLIYASRDQIHNQAVLLAEYFQREPSEDSR